MYLIDPPGGRPWALLGIAGGSLLLNVVLAITLATRGGGEPVERTVVVDPAAVEAAEAVSNGEAAQVVVPNGVNVVRAPIEGSLSATLVKAEPERGVVLEAVTTRLLGYSLDPRSQLQKGDEVRLVYEWDGQLPSILAMEYDSKDLGKTLTAYRFLATGDRFPSWWTAEGDEVALRLNEPVLADYEQITSRPKVDRKRHFAEDFKTPLGTDVFTPRAGKVVKTNWNFKFNGNCVEVLYADGTTARFLHLSETAVKPGESLAAGQRIGASGNTGHSTAPHLHYELEKNGQKIDPEEYHGTTRRTLPEADRAAFEAQKQNLQTLLTSAA
jgi:murein DD-endopeptidase